MMDKQEPQHDSDLAKTDPELDALLDEAVTTGTPPADPDLADRIYNRTLPMLAKRSVLARIGPTLLQAAAAVAIIAGGMIAVTWMNQQQTIQPADPIAFSHTTDRIAPGLATINNAVEPGNTRIDEQLDVLAIRVDLAGTDDHWGDDSLSTSDRIDRDVVRFEIDRFSDETYLLADEPALF